MIQARWAVLIVLAMLAFAGSAAGDMIYTTFYSGGTSDSLGWIDSSTGLGTVIGPFGNSNVVGLAFAPNGILYTDEGGYLATVDLSTGAATTFGTSSGARMLAFAADGTLYGAGLSGPSLLKLNSTTGAASTVGSLNFSYIMDLAFNSQGVLFAIASNPAANMTSSYIYSVNTSTGAGTLVATLNVPYLMGLTFDAAGNLYATNFVHNSILYEVDLTSQSVTPIGQAGGTLNSHGLDMNNFAPEPATWMLFGSGLLVYSGIRRAFRR